MKKHSPTWKETEQYKVLYHDMGIRPSAGFRYIPVVTNILKSRDIKSVWDYGCGVNHILLSHIKKRFPKIRSTGYDPVFRVNRKSYHNFITETPVDMIISTDCLEHLWETELDTCFGYWKKKNPKYIFVTTHNRLADKKLPDGTNVHKTVKPVEWWTETIQRHFPDHKVSNEFSKKVDAVRDIIFLEKH